MYKNSFQSYQVKLPRLEWYRIILKALRTSHLCIMSIAILNQHLCFLSLQSIKSLSIKPHLGLQVWFSLKNLYLMQENLWVVKITKVEMDQKCKVIIRHNLRIPIDSSLMKMWHFRNLHKQTFHLHVDKVD